MSNFVLSLAALPLLASSVLAQSISEVEPNDTSATANATVAGRQYYGALSPAGDVDFYSFTLAASQDVRIMTGPGFGAQLGDTIITLFDVDGATTLTSNDDFAGRGYYSQITRGNMPPGTYFVRVSPFTATATGSYVIEHYTTPVGHLVASGSLSPVSEGAEPNDPRLAGGAATPTNIFTRNAGNASLGAGGTSYTSATADYDFYAFTVTPAAVGSHTVATLATGTAPAPVCADTVIFLVDAAAPTVVLASNDDFGGLYSSFTYNITAPGTYYAVVKAYGAGDEGNYFLDITGPSGPAVVNATFAAAPGGCVGTAGTPSLNTRLVSTFHAIRVERPLIGTEFSVDITNVPALTPVIRLIGTLMPGVDITGTGCLLETNPILISAALSDAANYDWWNTVLPYDLSLRGVTVEMQGVVLDTGANAVGVTVTNRATAVLGNGY